MHRSADRGRGMRRSKPACSTGEEETWTGLLSYTVILFQVNVNYYNTTFTAGKASVVVRKRCQIYWQEKWTDLARPVPSLQRTWRRKERTDPIQLSSASPSGQDICTQLYTHTHIHFKKSKIWKHKTLFLPSTLHWYSFSKLEPLENKEGSVIRRTLPLL